MGYIIMLGNHITVGVVLLICLSLFISGLSLYVSRRYLPRKMKSAYLKAITVLAAAVETKDSGTVGHAQRVAQLTVDMAHRLGMRGRDLERIQYAALLMDMGKANVPHKLLNKTEPLTPQEWEIVKTHPHLGAQMVEPVPFLADLSDFIEHHHEYWDGSGYPSGLKGEQIPLISRILAAAADYDALVSERPYHQPCSPEEAVEEINKYSNSRYDPRVTKVLVEMVYETVLPESVEVVQQGPRCSRKR